MDARVGLDLFDHPHTLQRLFLKRRSEGPRRDTPSEFGKDLLGEVLLQGFLLVDGNVGTADGDVESDAAFLNAESRGIAYGGVVGVVTEAIPALSRR